jgi:hypothetical protein
MCVAIPIIAAGVGVAASLAGTGLAYSQGQAAMNAQQQANASAEQQQNTAFMQRMNAQQTQLAGETAANEKADQAFTTNQAETQAAQMAALGQTQSTTNQLNDQEQAISTAANDTVSSNLAAASAPALADAQAVQTQQQQSLNAPVVSSIQANNPLGPADTGPTASAMAASDAASAKYVSNYGDTLAKLSGYNAPITLANQQAQKTAIGLMPIASADTLLKGSAPAILAPSQLAYTQAGQLGSTINTSNQLDQQGALQLTDSAAADQTALANLQQEDSGALTQNQLTQEQQRAASLAGLGQGLTSIGNMGVYYGGASGALGGLGKAIAGAVKPSAVQVGGFY